MARKLCKSEKRPLKKCLLICAAAFISSGLSAQSSLLKSVIYDFDGLDLGQTNLPDGDYKNFDLSYKVSADPLSAGGILGDRVLELDLNWQTGKGEFGKGISRYIELNASRDRLDFYIYNPLSNADSASVQISITEDDNQDNIYNASADDQWIFPATLPRSNSWQPVSIPLSSFSDNNAGGNGIFDAGYSGNKGMVFVVSLTFKNKGTVASSQYFIDMICFSEGALPAGSSATALPSSQPGDHCPVGSLAYKNPIDSVPYDVESLFNPSYKIRYVNIFMAYAYSGTTANDFPGSSVYKLLQNGYRPIITWESYYSAYPPLDPVQPKLNDILSGNFNAYIDSFAGVIKSFNDTVIMRPFHEFDGNWYPWSITQNGSDPSLIASAFRYLVGRFRAKGATKALWMFSPNSTPVPSASYNWLVSAYPGDSYVDLIGTSVYNHPDPGTPPWLSFRYVAAEAYYYSRAYFPSKPFIIAEAACRERDSSEPASSQTKAGWLCDMSAELKSFFHETSGLVFFNTLKNHDWRINSSGAALQAMQNCFWNDPYFLQNPYGIQEFSETLQPAFFPNPFSDQLTLRFENERPGVIRVFDLCGRLCEEVISKSEEIKIGRELLPGVYVVKTESQKYVKALKVVKEKEN